MNKQRRKTKGYSISKRTENSYKITVANGYDHLGKQKRYFKTIKVNPDDYYDENELRIYVESCAILFKREVLSGDYESKKKTEIVTFEQACNYFISTLDGSYTQKGVRNTTKLDYSTILKTVLKTCKFKNSKVVNIKKKDVAEYINTLTYTESYVNRILRVIKMVFKRIIDDEMIEDFYKSPIESLKFIPTENMKANKVKRTLEIDEINQLLNLLEDNNTINNILKFTFLTGCRPQEAMGFTVDCVDFVNKTITIDKTLVFVNKEYSFNLPKNGKTRTIPMNQSLENLIKNQMMINDKIRSYAKVDNDDLLFMTDNGHYMYYGKVARKFKSMIKGTSFENITWKYLRHTVVSYLIDKGYSFETVSKLLGHTPEVEERIYTHVLKSKEQQIFDELDLDKFKKIS